MTSQRKVEHVRIRVQNLEAALRFYTDVMGLCEVARDDGAAYLGCGLDMNFDVAIEEGGTGMDHFAIRVPQEATVDDYETRFADAGIAVERTDGAEPGQLAGVQFQLPNEVTMEVVAVEDTDYHHSDQAVLEGRGGVAPRDLDHVTYLTPNVREDVEFLTTHLDFRVSEVLGTRTDWHGAFTRFGDLHHDVAVIEASHPESPTDYASLHHVAWTMTSIDHMKSFIDHISRAGVDLEIGIGRHYAGDNIYSYFQTPGGNRVELTAEMATVDAETTRFTEDIDAAFSAWGQDAPSIEFQRGSGIVR
jgi:catechol 2,3-dioxygenase